MPPTKHTCARSHARTCTHLTYLSTIFPVTTIALSLPPSSIPVASARGNVEVTLPVTVTVATSPALVQMKTPLVGGGVDECERGNVKVTLTVAVTVATSLALVQMKTPLVGGGVDECERGIVKVTLTVAVTVATLLVSANEDTIGGRRCG